MTDRNTPRNDPQSESDRLAVNEILRKRAVERHWQAFTDLANAVWASEPVKAEREALKCS